MNLIEVLCSGVRGAENGFVEVFSRGTSNHAQIFTSYDGSGASTPTGPLTLDANGGRLLYVNEEVDCVVTGATGTTVRAFSPMVTASNVEARSQSFTGVDYATGASAASSPVALSTILDRWKTSAGTSDFNVLINGVATTLQTMVANTTSGVYFNVKASTYGAIGDGSIDDTSAIQAASTAASAAGGGTVYFPPGTYKISQVITFGPGVSVLGAGSAASTIAVAGTIGTAFQFQGPATTGIWTFLRDISLTQTSGRTTSMVALTNTMYIRIDNCKIATTAASGATTAAIYEGSGNGRIIVTATTIDHSLAVAANNTKGILTSSGTILAMIGCSFLYPATFNGTSIDNGINGSGAVLIGCDFQLGSITAGTSICWTVNPLTGAVSPSALIGCFFQSSGGGTITPYSAPTWSRFVEAGNIFGTGLTLPTPTVTVQTATGEGQIYATRQHRSYVIASDAAALTLPASQYGTVQVVKSTNAIQTLNFDTPPGAGHHLTLSFNNNNAAVTGTITIGTGGVKGLANFTVNANRVSYYHFKSVAVAAPAGAWYWSLVGSDVNEVP